MKKIAILILMLLLMPIVLADMCEDRVTKPCTMLTPSLDCGTYNYSIYTKDGDLVKQDNLTQLSSSIYYFEFNQSTGAYIVELCDDSTREIFVGGVSNMYGWDLL